MHMTSLCISVRPHTMPSFQMLLTTHILLSFTKQVCFLLNITSFAMAVIKFLSSWGCLFQVGHAMYQERNQVSESGTYRYLNLSSRVTAENRALSLTEIFSLFKLLTAELNRSNQRNPRENGTRLIDFFGDRTVFTVLHITYYYYIFLSVISVLISLFQNYTKNLEWWRHKIICFFMAYYLIQAIFHSKFVMFALNCDLKTTGFPSDGHHKAWNARSKSKLWPV